MYNLLLQIALFASLGAIVYLIARAVPRIPETSAPAPGKDWFDRVLTRLPLHETDLWLNARFEKLLRRAKVIILKFDNLVAHLLKRVRKGSKSADEDKGENLFSPPDSGTKE